MRRLKQINSEYIKFTIGGLLAAVFELLLTFFLAKFFHLNQHLSYGISLVIGTYLVFKYHKFITFDQHDKPTKRLIKFYLTITGLTVINWLAVYVLTKKLNITSIEYYLLAIIVVTISLQLLNFLINKLWVFRQYPRK